MASKKKSAFRDRITARPAADAAPAVKNGHGVAEAAAATASAPTEAPSTQPNMPRTRLSQRPWFERIVIRIAKSLGSLQIAVSLLSFLVVVLAVGTFIESHYGGPVARQLVYQSWWFYLLMAGLFLNIFFAAAKKWPWKKHQTGFVITHTGLLLLIIGGVWNSLVGVDSLMSLASDDSDQVRRLGYVQESDVAIDPDDTLVSVAWPDRYQDITRKYNFAPGWLSWRSDPEQGFRRELQPALQVLDTLAHPLPRGWSQDLADDAEVEIVNFFSHAKTGAFEAYSESRDVGQKTGSAVQIKLKNASDKLNMPVQEIDEWLYTHGSTSGDSDGSMKNLGVVDIRLFDLFGRATPAQIQEFVGVPGPVELGTRGQLVILVDGLPCRFKVDEVLDRSLPLRTAERDTGWKVRVNRYSTNPLEGRAQSGQGMVSPTVYFDLLPPDPGQATVSMVATAVAPGVTLPLSGGVLPPGFEVWYHPADYRFGNRGLRGALQFMFAEDPSSSEEPTLYYRSFALTSPADAPVDLLLGGAARVPGLVPQQEPVLALEKGGKVPVGTRLGIWDRMNWQLKVTEVLPKALPSYTPVNKRPGLEDPRYSAVVECLLKVGEETKSFWLPKTDEANRRVGAEVFRSGRRTVEISDTRVEVGFHPYTIELPFTVKLLRGEQTTDPGSNEAATFSSFVAVKDEDGETFEQQITMNEPLEYRGYKLFQTSLNVRGLQPDEETLKPKSISTFTVSSDPGIWLKYLGSVLLALGIFLMFYMRAYFLTGKRRV